MYTKLFSQKDAKLDAVFALLLFTDQFIIIII